MDTLVENFVALLGRESVLSHPHELLAYECDGLTHYKAAPRAVIFPRSTEQVSEIMRVLARGRVSFAPRGAGTGLSGGALAVGRGVVIELARMRALLEVDVENRLAVVQTGMVNAQLSRAVAPHKLHYAPDPSSQTTCTIGGNIAENAGGIHCLKYGTTVDHVLAARVVLSDGEVVDLGGAGCGAAGYDLLGVFVGSEGTFGIATEATVRLTPLPHAVRTLLADFLDIDDASRAVSSIIAEGIIPAALEMVDGATIRAVEASVFAAGLPTDAGAALLVELDGIEAGLDEETARVESICLKHGARRCRRAADEGERSKLWAARKGAFGAMGRISPDLMLQDAVVPRSRLPEVLADTYRIGAKYALKVANVFHAGDGNLHPYICFDARDAEEVARVKEAGREIMEACVRAGGTITGEHGVGLDKREYLPLVFSDDTLRAMLRVRAAFDPLGICNPGKVIPALRGCGEARAVAAAKETVGKAKGREEKNADRDADSEDVLSSASLLNTFQPARSAHHNVAHTSSTRTVEEAKVCDDEDDEDDKASDKLTASAASQHVDERDDEPLVVEPSSVEEACEILRTAAGEGRTVVPSGGGTWLDIGNRTRRADVVIKTTRLARIVGHEPADLVVTAQSGVTLARLDAELAGAGQWLPVDPPDDGRSTIGGVAAAAACGAQSHAYGRPRAHVLGMSVALADGSVIRVGGRVVKNVAGYDLCKLFVGSYGTLGLILDLTLKLRPRPPDRLTLITRASDYRPLLAAARAVLDAGLLPVAAEVLSPRLASEVAVVGDDAERFALLVRFAGAPEAVAWQTSTAFEIFGSIGGLGPVESLREDEAVWTSLRAVVARRTRKIVWRADVLPSQLVVMIASMDEPKAVRAADRVWHAGACDGRLRVFDDRDMDDSEHAALLERLRATARGYKGSLVVEHAPAGVERMIDAWGIPEPLMSVMRRVKSQLDPRGVFSPGRF